jgi:hypothetical protein
MRAPWTTPQLHDARAQTPVTPAHRVEAESAVDSDPDDPYIACRPGGAGSGGPPDDEPVQQFHRGTDGLMATG